VTSGADEGRPQSEDPQREGRDDGVDEEREPPRDEVPPDYLDPKPMDVTGR
jgi:hypothetical protein